MPLKDISNKELATLAEQIGTTYGYLIQLKYGKHRKPSAEMARRLEEATKGRVSRWDLLYPDEKPESVLN